MYFIEVICDFFVVVFEIRFFFSFSRWIKNSFGLICCWLPLMCWCVWIFVLKHFELLIDSLVSTQLLSVWDAIHSIQYFLICFFRCFSLFANKLYSTITTNSNRIINTINYGHCWYFEQAKSMCIIFEAVRARPPSKIG